MMSSDLENKLREALAARARTSPNNLPPTMQQTATGDRRRGHFRVFAVAAVTAGIVVTAVVAGLAFVDNPQSAIVTDSSIDPVRTAPAPTADTKPSATSAGAAATTIQSVLTAPATTAPATTTTGQQVSTTTTPSSSFSDVVGWVGAIPLTPDDVTINWGSVHATAVRIDRTATELCITFNSDSDCVNVRPDGTIEMQSGTATASDPSGTETPSFHYWLVSDDIDIAVVTGTGLPECNMFGGPVPALGPAALWICETDHAYTPGSRVLFTRDGGEYRIMIATA